MLQQFKKWCFHSWTIAWGYIQIVAGSLMASLGAFGNIITDADVKGAMANLGLNPKIMMAFAVAGAITLVCRLRTVNKPTDENNQVIEA